MTNEAMPEDIKIAAKEVAVYLGSDSIQNAWPIIASALLAERNRSLPDGDAVPVAWLCRDEEGRTTATTIPNLAKLFREAPGSSAQPLYASPPNLNTIRDEALEEAAKVAEKCEGKNVKVLGRIEWKKPTVFDAAAAIRSLKGTGGGPAK